MNLTRVSASRNWHDMPGHLPSAEARVMRLRGYGNAIVAPQAATFTGACMDILDGGLSWA